MCWILIARDNKNIILKMFILRLPLIYTFTTWNTIIVWVVVFSLLRFLFYWNEKDAKRREKNEMHIENKSKEIFYGFRLVFYTTPSYLPSIVISCTQKIYSLSYHASSMYWKMVIKMVICAIFIRCGIACQYLTISKHIELFCFFFGFYVDVSWL